MNDLQAERYSSNVASSRNEPGEIVSSFKGTVRGERSRDNIHINPVRLLILESLETLQFAETFLQCSSIIVQPSRCTLQSSAHINSFGLASHIADEFGLSRSFPIVLLPLLGLSRIELC